MAPSRRVRSGNIRRTGSGTAIRERALLESPALAVPLAELLTPHRLVLDSWFHERTFDRPGAGVTALCRVAALDPAGARISLYAGITTAPAAVRGPVLRTSAAGTPLFLWLHPHDPLLPDLPWALSPEQIGQQVFGGADSAGVRSPSEGSCPGNSRAVAGLHQGGAPRPGRRPPAAA